MVHLPVDFAGDPVSLWGLVPMERPSGNKGSRAGHPPTTPLLLVSCLEPSAG